MSRRGLSFYPWLNQWSFVYILQIYRFKLGSANALAIYKSFLMVHNFLGLAMQNQNQTQIWVPTYMIVRKSFKVN